MRNANTQTLTLLRSERAPYGDNIAPRIAYELYSRRPCLHNEEPDQSWVPLGENTRQMNAALDCGPFERGGPKSCPVRGEEFAYQLEREETCTSTRATCALNPVLGQGIKRSRLHSSRPDGPLWVD